MILDLTLLEKLLKSEISAYQIAKHTGLSITLVLDLRSGRRSAQRISFANAEKLIKYQSELENEKNT